MRNVATSGRGKAVSGQSFTEFSEDSAENASDRPETPFDDATDDAKKQRERPAGSGKGGGDDAKKKTRYFPVAIRRTVGLTKEWGQGEFIKYWKKVAADPDLRDRAVCYVYRTFPVTDINMPGDQLDDEATKRPKYIDCTSQAFESDEDVWNRYGAGDYKFYLNDSGFPGRSKTQMVCHFSGTREWSQYPPEIDPATLDMADPKNASYIRYLQQKGLLPKSGQEDDEEDMANQALSDTVTKLTDRVIEMASRPESPVVAPARSVDETNVASAVKAITQSFQAANEVQMKMLSVAVEQATAVQARTQDPFETLARVISTMKSLYPQQDNSALEAALRRSEQIEARLGEVTTALQDQRIKDLEQRLATAQQMGQPKDSLTQAREFAQTQRELKEIFGMGKESDDDEPSSGRREPREPWYAKHAPMALGFAGFLLAGITNIVHNSAVAKTGHGQPVAPPPPPGELVPAAMQQVAGALAGGQPNGRVMSTLSPQEQQISTFVQIIKVPLERSIEGGGTGHDFAAWLADSYGDMAYQSIRGGGQEGILSNLHRFAPELFVKMQAAPERSALFLSQFLEGPTEEGDEEGEEK